MTPNTATDSQAPRPTWTRSTTTKPQIVTGIDDRGQSWAWVGVPLGGEPHLGERGWFAQYRLALQNGRLVVAEIRVCPARWAYDDDPSQSGESMGIGAADVPPGGLSQRSLRTAKVAAHVDSTAELLQRLRALGIACPAWVPDTLPTSRRARASAARTAGGTRPGRRPLPDTVLLEAAGAYLAARKRGSPRPVPEAAKTLAMSEARMRDLIYRARRPDRGLLTPTTQGYGGGAFTPKALALLQATRRKRSPAPRRRSRSRRPSR